jgi:hypothetical protein
MTENHIPAEPSIRTVLQLTIADLSPSLRVQLASLLADTTSNPEVELPDDFDIPWVVPISLLDECFPFIRITNEDLQAFNPHYADLSDSDLAVIAQVVRLHLLYDLLWPEIGSHIDNNRWPAT